jgi:N-acetylneuraminic acid mutarotase
MVTFARGICIALTIGIVTSAHAQEAAKPTAENPWVTLAPFPEPSEELLGATANGKFYVFAGLAQWKPKGLVFEYDPASNIWAKKKPMALLVHQAALVSLADKIYLFGGFKYPGSGPAAWQPIDNTWEYNPATDEWKALAAMPSKRGGAAAAVVDGKIYVIGGAGVTPGSPDTAILPARRHMILGNVDEYDPKTNTWRARASLPTPRSHFAIAAVANKIYVIGGRIGSAFLPAGSNTDIVEAYDPLAGAWSAPLVRMPNPRSAAGAAVWHNRIFILGGEAPQRGASTVFKTAETYDPARNEWKTLPAMPLARRSFAAGVIGDRLYTVGGEVPGDVSSQALQLDVLK